MSAKPPKKSEPVSNPDVTVGDEVYFQHGKGPQSAKVAATGRHGITVHHENKHHRVKWEHVLGHKKRVAQKYNVLDEGEDGLIVQDEKGQRRYINVPPEARGEKMVLDKSFSDTGRIVFFAKAGTIANRPGLALQEVQHKDGTHGKHWVRTTKDTPSGKPGGGQEQPKTPPKHVGFQNGEHQGHGKVIASGEHGHTVQDAAGGTHRVPHSAVTHEWHHDDAPDKSPHDDAPASNNDNRGPEEIARALFDTSELAKLPPKTFQPVDSWEELEAKGKEGLAQFSEMLGNVAKTLGLETGKRPQSYDNAVEKESNRAKEEGREAKAVNKDDYMLPEHWDSDKGFLFMGPLKGKDRATEKVKSDYVTKEKPEGDWSQIRDMVRATIAVPMVTQIPKVLDELKKAGIHLAQQPKNNLVKPLPGGYRDLNLIVKLPNGLLAELQVHIKPMTLAKEKGHKPYETTRSIEGKYKQKGIEDKAQWDDADREKHGTAMAEQEKLYGDAWDRATGAKKNNKSDESNLTKSTKENMIVLWKFAGVKK